MIFLNTKTMKKLIVYVATVSSMILFTSCVHILPISLDTAEDNDPYFAINNVKNQDYLDKFTATDIFTDEIRNTWGTEKDACREFTVVDSIKKAGASSLLITWDKSKKGCDWIGSGWAWNNWQVVDMSSIVDTWAVRFWVRTKEGKMANIPINLSFTDDGNKSSETVKVSDKFFKGPGIDENWKEVIIPLTYFRFIPKGVNTTGINLMLMTLEGTGSIYIDEFQLIDLSTVTENKQTNTFIATNVFTDAITNTWGIDKDACREFVTVTDIKKNGTSSLYMSWDKSKKGCDVINAGIAWNNWQSVNMVDIINTWSLHFWIRTKDGKMTTIPLNLSFIDDGNAVSKNIDISNKYYKGTEIDENWKEVTIPLTEFGCKEAGLNLFDIRQLIMTFEGAASIYIDDIQFIPTAKQVK